jgi:hypothetical protein
MTDGGYKEYMAFLERKGKDLPRGCVPLRERGEIEGFEAETGKKAGILWERDGLAAVRVVSITEEGCAAGWIVLTSSDEPRNGSTDGRDTGCRAARMVD